MLIASIMIHCMCLTLFGMNASSIMFLRIMSLSVLLSIMKLCLTKLGMISLNILIVSMMTLSIMKHNILKRCMA